MLDENRIQPGISRPLAYRRTRSSAQGGLLAGLLSGTVLLVFALIAWGISGQEVTTPFTLISATFFPRWAANGGAGPVIGGLFIHYVASICWGMLFACMIGQAKTATAFAWGIVYGLGVGLIMRFTVVPVIGSGALASTAVWPFILAHAVYGLSLGTYRVFAQGLDRRRASPELFVPAHRQA